MGDGVDQINGLAVPSLFDVAGKVVVVTGGSRGIGLMIASGFVANGAEVYITARSAGDCDAAAAQLNKLGPGKCASIPADLSKESECKRFTEEVKKRAGRCDVLICNAGANWAANLDTFPMDAWDKVQNLNLRSVFHLTQLFIPLLLVRGTPSSPSRVINIGSIDGLTSPSLETFAYSSSKAALHHLTHHLAAHLGPRGITINAVAPGPFQSKMMKATLERMGDQIAKRAPMKRIGRPGDMAGVCLFLASEAGSYVNGVVLPVDGGICISANL
ncbi:short-chain dehydrogenase/reductase-like protein SDR [Hyaloraphidium curvatum]|nr:short-chain dehydrogenase/reductase-like protein SDR [Hyaloraphidium curvatum]